MKKLELVAMNLVYGLVLKENEDVYGMSYDSYDDIYASIGYDLESEHLLQLLNIFGTTDLIQFTQDFHSYFAESEKTEDELLKHWGKWYQWGEISELEYKTILVHAVFCDFQNQDSYSLINLSQVEDLLTSLPENFNETFNLKSASDLSDLLIMYNAYLDGDSDSMSSIEFLNLIG